MTSIGRKSILFIFLFTNYAHAYWLKKPSPCAIEFMPEMKRFTEARNKSESYLSAWNDDFDFMRFEMIALSNKLPNEQLDILKEMSALVYNDRMYADNIAELLTHWAHKNPNLVDDLIKSLTHKNSSNPYYKLYYLPSESRFYSVSNISSDKKQFIRNMIKLHDKSAIGQEQISNTRSMNSKQIHDLLTKYQEQLFVSSLNLDELNLLQKHWVPQIRKRDYEQFVEYIDFIKKLEPRVKKVAIKNINKIYNYGYKPLPGSLNFVKAPHKQFLSQQHRVNKKTINRYNELIIEHEKRSAGGKATKLEKAKYLHQAKHEMNIYRRFLNGCGGGRTHRIDNAAKKFSAFKLSLLLTINPAMYYKNNIDKKESDPYFWEKLGHEVAMGLVFTYVGNKLVTNTSTSFGGKYIEGYWKFGLLGLIDTTTYDLLFGSEKYIRYIKGLYNNGEINENEIEKELKRILNDPNANQEIQKIIDYLNDRKKDQNLKNILNKHFNLHASSSIDDNTRITQEDLESEEAREFLMELIAEKIYLGGMGQWPVFQTGNKGTDRWAFYNTRNILFDLKGLALNLAMFEMMCSEPFGKVGSWTAIVSMVIADYYMSGALTYSYRREAINQ